MAAINAFFASLGSWLQSPLLLILRLFFGIGFIFAGWGKLQDIPAFTQNLIALNVPYPEVGAWAAALSETIGGALLTVGLFSRLASIPLIIVMATAYATAHVESLHVIATDPKVFVEQGPFNFLLTALLVLAFGPGIFSLDALICGRSCTVTKKEP